MQSEQGDFALILILGSNNSTATFAMIDTVEPRYKEVGYNKTLL